ncbi:hypothetical protein EKH57_00175 (plasmid) [Halorubrum sp. BOL3-1]|uniref:hypothetical protein n=1 Tax=Halorubrum sp. BOL3-1 TaxID=2497325 RepID=UPI001004FAF8|nr:hypothetical protein [Halorubrum sp. BOL3-1]QAU11345.1 hypothetical protein EKH57_00175 [Halorubrum sp. BOL3-1]
MFRSRTRTQVQKLAVVVIVLLLPVGAGLAGTTAAAQQAEVPAEVTTTCLGDSGESNHALTLRVSVTPQDRTLESTEVDIDSTTQAFISASSVDTIVSTEDGRQVVTRVKDNPGAFTIDRLRPGEEVIVEMELYPRTLVPNGDRLASVEVTTQFAANSRIVSESVDVAPRLPAEDVAVVQTPAVPLPAGIGGGVVAGGLVAGLAGLVLWRRKTGQLQRILGQLDTAVMSAEARELVSQARSVIGTSGSEDVGIGYSAGSFDEADSGSTVDSVDEETDEFELEFEHED